MALEVVYGESRNRSIATALSEELRQTLSEGTIYLGYPVLASADERVEVDALLVSKEHGLVAFQLADGIPALDEDWARYVSAQDRLYGVLESHLGRHDELRAGRRLALSIETITVFASTVGSPPNGTEGHYCDLDGVAAVVDSLPGIDQHVERSLQAALQRVTTIKPAKRRLSVRRDESRGAILKKIEKGIANLDRWQKRAAIESPEGPQRVRGLAGSGKTIVLALKAAYLHAQHPEWRVALTFQSRALYQQFEDLVTRFTFEHSDDRPDFEHLQLMHAWGSATRDGVYTSIASAMGVTPRDFNYARVTFGMDEAFRGVCGELLTIASQSRYEPIFDAVLIDEAQDLPPEFFQLVYRFTREPKRIVWGFDELQRLSEAAMPSTEELFGTTPSGESLVTLTEREGEARQDIILPVCYRNSPWSLATAHALGFGIYRTGGLVQHFDDPQLWEDIGYRVVQGRLGSGSHVILERASTSYPSYFPDLLKSDDAVLLRSFEDELEQDSWVSTQIVQNLQEDELEHDDILVVLPDAYTSKRRTARFARTLARYGIDCHLVGVGSSVDQVFVRGSVAVAHIHRAKGNEAPMVYVLDAQFAISQGREVTRRNTLFTAITRSRAWVRICGHGPRMAEVSQEVDAVRKRSFRLDFTIPTASDLAQLRRIHRDRSSAEAASLRRATQSLKDLVESFEREEIELDDLPPGLRTRLVRRLRGDFEDFSDEVDE